MARKINTGKMIVATDIVELLLAEGADVNAKDSHKSWIMADTVQFISR